MTKKHFIALAAIFRNIGGDDSPICIEWMGTTWMRVSDYNKVVRDVADLCAESNERFDRPKFLKACGMEETNE